MKSDTQKGRYTLWAIFYLLRKNEFSGTLNSTNSICFRTNRLKNKNKKINNANLLKAGQKKEMSQSPFNCVLVAFSYFAFNAIFIKYMLIYAR